jgi:hypothetical protein
MTTQKISCIKDKYFLAMNVAWHRGRVFSRLPTSFPRISTVVPPMTLVLLFFAATLLLPCHAFAFAAAPPPFSSSIASSRHRVTTVELSSSCGIGMRNATLSSTKPLKLHSARGGGGGGMVESSSINNYDDTIISATTETRQVICIVQILLPMFGIMDLWSVIIISGYLLHWP